MYACDVCMWCMHVMYACDVCVWCMHVMHACDACMWCMHVMYACDVCMWCMHVKHTCDVWMWCMHVMYACDACILCMRCMYLMYACDVCIRCMHVMYVSDVCMWCMHVMYACGVFTVLCMWCLTFSVAILNGTYPFCSAICEKFCKERADKQLRKVRMLIYGRYTYFFTHRFVADYGFVGKVFICNLDCCCKHMLWTVFVTSGDSQNFEYVHPPTHPATHPRFSEFPHPIHLCSRPLIFYI